MTDKVVKINALEFDDMILRLNSFIYVDNRSGRALEIKGNEIHHIDSIINDMNFSITSVEFDIGEGRSFSCDGTTARYCKGGILDRGDGPADICISRNGEGNRSWFRAGQLHRLDGPAIERGSYREFHFFGRNVTQEVEARMRENGFSYPFGDKEQVFLRLCNIGWPNKDAFDHLVRMFDATPGNLARYERELEIALMIDHKVWKDAKDIRDLRRIFMKAA